MKLIAVVSLIFVASLFLEGVESRHHRHGQQPKIRRRKNAEVARFDTLWQPGPDGYDTLWEEDEIKTVLTTNQLYKGLRDRSSYIGKTFASFKQQLMDATVSAFPPVDLYLTPDASVRVFSNFADGLPQRKIAEKLFVYDMIMRHIVQHYHSKSANLASVSGTMRTMMQNRPDCCVPMKRKVIMKIKEIIQKIYDWKEDEESKEEIAIAVAKCIIDEATIYESMKDYGNGIRSYKLAVNVMQESFDDPDSNPLYRWSLFNAGMTLHRLLNKHQKSISWFNRAIASYKRANPEEGEVIDEWYAAAYYNKGQALMSLKRYEEAVDSLQKAVDLLTSATSMLITDDYRNYWRSTAEKDLQMCKEKLSIKS